MTLDNREHPSNIWDPKYGASKNSNDVRLSQLANAYSPIDESDTLDLKSSFILVRPDLANE